MSRACGLGQEEKANDNAGEAKGKDANKPEVKKLTPQEAVKVKQMWMGVLLECR